MNIIWSSKSQRTDDVVLPATEKVLPLNEVLTRLTTDGHSQQGCSTFPVDHMLLSRPVIQLLKRKFVKVSWLISWFKLLYIQCMIRANHSELPFHAFFVQILQRCTCALLHCHLHEKYEDEVSVLALLSLYFPM